MKVKILSGNQAGAIVEMREDEAETAISTGYGEAVSEDGTPLKAPIADLKEGEPEADEPDKRKVKGKGKRK
jgi:hypothetical protein